VEFIRTVRCTNAQFASYEQVLFPNRHTEGDLVAISVSGGHLIGYGGSFVDYKLFALEEMEELNLGWNAVAVGDAPSAHWLSG
jgi:hypothetical protein